MKSVEGILQRIRNRVDGLGECSTQIMVPKTLRRKVMEIAHNSIFGEHLKIKKIRDRIQTNTTGLACKVMLLVSADHVMYVRRQ